MFHESNEALKKKNGEKKTFSFLCLPENTHAHPPGSKDTWGHPMMHLLDVLITRQSLNVKENRGGHATAPPG